MKKIILTITILTLLYTSCSDNFLEVAPVSSLSEENFYRTPEDALIALNGVYNCVLLGLSTNADGCEMILYDLMTDNGVNVNTAYFPHNIVTGQMTASSPAPRLKWERAYKGVNRANLLISKLNQCFTNSDNIELKKRIEGEVLFLRSYFYFGLIDFFDAVPLRLTPPDLSNANFPRTPKHVVLDTLLKDLDNVIENKKLPIRYEAGKGVGRVTHGAALTLKGKLLLYNNRFNEAANTFKQVIDLLDEKGVKRYSLYPNFKELFLSKAENNDEVIFDVQYIPGYYNKDDLDNTLTTSYNISVAHYNSFGATLSLACEFYTKKGYPVKGYPFGPFYSEDTSFNSKKPHKNLDPRYYETITAPADPISGGKYFAPTGSNATGLRLKKGAEFTDIAVPEAQVSHNNIIIMRYADVLLMYAESLIRSGRWNNADVNKSINEVRQRPSVMMPKIEDCEAIWDAPLDESKLFKILQHERRVELAFEGQRISDIRRWKIGSLVMGDAYGYLNSTIGVIGQSRTPNTVWHGVLSEQYEWKGTVAQRRVWDEMKSYLWPIPDLEITTNKDLGNNPTYPEIKNQNYGY
jgi:tetratricopeptide (TPR) repeat protein